MSKPTFLGPLIGKGVGQCELAYAESGSVLASHVEPAFESKARKKGLLGRESVPDDYAMIIAPCSAIHTFFMRVPIDLVFVSRNGTITKTCRGVKPWRLAGSMKAFAVIEAAEGFVGRHELVPGEIVELRATANSTRTAGPAPAAEPVVMPSRHTSRKRATLADVIAAKTALAWFESVSIVQELCKTVLARGPADDLRIPELKHIVLTGDGSVTLLADGPGGHSPVQRAGLVLLALTPEEQLPMQLRLLVLEAVSPRPRLNSLKDLHLELEFFERPDRQSIVQQAYERFQRQPGPAALAPSVPPPLLEPPSSKRPHRWLKRRSVWAGSLMALIALALAAGIWAWPRPEGRWLRTNADLLSQASLETGRKAIQVVRRQVNAAKWKLGFRPREPEPSVLVLADAPPPSTPELGGNITLDGGAPAPAVPPFQLVKTPLSGAPEPLAEAPVPEAEPRAAAPGAVFSAADTQVVPPRLISPRASAKPKDSVGAQPAPEVELTVSPAGEVESVKLVSGRTTALSGMQISTLKAWRFEPATQDGQPVRYRLRVRLPVQ